MIRYPDITWGDCPDHDKRYKGTAKGFEFDVPYHWSGEHKGTWSAIVNHIPIGTGEFGDNFPDADAAKTAAEAEMKRQIDGKVAAAQKILDRYTGEDEKPLNYEGPTASEVVKKLGVFLTKPVRAEDSEWPKVTDEHLRELYHMFHAIIEAKYERDCDSDMVVEFALGRRNYGSLMAVNLPHSPEKDLEDAFDALAMAGAISEAANRMITGKLRMIEAEKRRKREWKEKCAVLVEAANGPLKGTRVARSLLEWSEGGTLFTGWSVRRGVLGDTDQWEPLGLTAKYVCEAYNDHADRDQPFNAIEAACKKLLTLEEESVMSSST